MILSVLLAACSNVEPPGWSGGGVRYSSGYAADFSSDTASEGDDTGGSTTGDPDGPRLLTGSAGYAVNEADETYVQVGIAYTDDPDDLDGGTLYFSLYANGELDDQAERSMVEGSTDPAKAGVNDGTISFQAGPVDGTATHVVTVYVVDYTRNRSNEIDIEVTSE